MMSNCLYHIHMRALRLSATKRGFKPVSTYLLMFTSTGLRGSNKRATIVETTERGRVIQKDHYNIGNGSSGSQFRSKSGTYPPINMLSQCTANYGANTAANSNNNTHNSNIFPSRPTISHLITQNTEGLPFTQRYDI
jgi:hypothetical protein